MFSKVERAQRVIRVRPVCIWSASVTCVLLLLIVPLAASETTQSLVGRLELPIECRQPGSCRVFKYFDSDPGRGPDRASDYRCGNRTSDGHNGTDFAIEGVAAMRKGIEVLAAAAGTVSAVRDGLPDVSSLVSGWAMPEDRKCGNGVRIDHGGGWTTLYCHLRNGSVGVTVGEEIVAGAKLGLVGLSGSTEYPHLHFAVRYDGLPVDPFVGLASADDCKPSGEHLWTERAFQRLDYRPVHINGIGFATGKIDRLQARSGLIPERYLAADIEAIVLWADVLAVRSGDVMTFVITSPDGVEIHRATQTLERGHAQWFQYSGRRLKGKRLAAGTYSGRVTIGRRGEPSASASRDVHIEVIP